MELKYGLRLQQKLEWEHGNIHQNQIQVTMTYQKLLMKAVVWEQKKWECFLEEYYPAANYSVGTTAIV